MGWVQVGNIRGPKGDPGNDQGLVHGPVSGAVTLDASIEAHILSATGPTTITMGTPPFPGQVVSLIITAGGKNVIVNADAFPKGQPSLDDLDVVNFVAIDGKTWWCFGTGAAVPPDTTPPSAPTVSVASFTDTSITLAVTRGVDAESTPTLMVRSYVSGAATKPDFAAMTPANGQLVISGLSQLTTYVIEVQEVSKGGTSAVSSVTQKTAMTHGWVVSSTATFDAPDGTDPATLKMSDGQAITKSGSGAATIVNNALTLTTAQAANGAATFTFPSTATLRKGRVRAQYAFSPGSGKDTALKLWITGAYPLNGVGLALGGDGALALDVSTGTHATWSAPVWTGSQTGLPSSGTLSLSVDADAKTVYVWSDGVQIASSTCTETIPGLSGGRIDLALWSGGGVSVSQADILTFQ